MSEEFDDLMLEMRAEYREGLQERAEELEAAWKLANDRDTEAIGLQRLVSAAHKLNGSARVFGFEDIGNRAEALENYATLQQSRFSGAERIQFLEDLFRALLKALSQTRQEAIE